MLQLLNTLLSTRLYFVCVIFCLFELDSSAFCSVADSGACTEPVPQVNDQSVQVNESQIISRLWNNF